MTPPRPQFPDPSLAARSLTGDGTLAVPAAFSFAVTPRVRSGARTGRGSRRASPFDACPLKLVRKAQRGSRCAFARLWERYAPTAKAILMTMVQESDADDLTQDVAVAAMRALPSLEQPARFPSWLASIARNLGRDALKSRRSRGQVPLSEAMHVEAPATGDAAAADEIVQQIRELPECHREPLMLRLVLEMSGEEISVHTGMTHGSVRVNLCRGMKLLRQRLERLGATVTRGLPARRGGAG